MLRGTSGPKVLNHGSHFIAFHEVDKSAWLQMKILSNMMSPHKSVLPIPEDLKEAALYSHPVQNGTHAYR